MHSAWLIFFSFPRSNFGLSRHCRLQITLPRWTDRWRRHSWSQPHRPSLIKIWFRIAIALSVFMRYVLLYMVHLPRSQVYNITTHVQLRLWNYNIAAHICIGTAAVYRFVSRNINHTDGAEIPHIVFIQGGWKFYYLNSHRWFG